MGMYRNFSETYMHHPVPHFWVIKISAKNLSEVGNTTRKMSDIHAEYTSVNFSKANFEGL